MKRINSLIILLLLASCSVSFAQEETSTQQPVVEIPKADTEKVEKDIQNAYKKEYAFLTTQIKSIKERTQQFKKSSKQEELDINHEISKLENKLLSLEKQADQLDDDIFAMQRNSETAADNNNLLKATITQAKSTLSEFNFDASQVFEDSNEIEKIASLVNFAVTVLNQSSSITKQPGAFFLQSGKEVKGTLIKIGNIATYGQSPEGSGALAPAGENTFKVWNQEDDKVVKEILSANSKTSLPIFLYESSIKGIEEKQEKTVVGVIDSGGIIAWIIAALGIVAVLLIALRFWFLKKASSSTEKILNKVVRHIHNEDMDAAINVAKSKKSSSARVLYSVLRNITRDREHIEDVVSESILHESGQLNRFGSLIMVIATVSPLLGLLGTVTGMISTFDIITEYGTGDPKLLSEGISVALVTTEVGLAVAIPALVFGNILSGWAERIKDEMEKAALRVINIYKLSF